ncbi:hypothetical protein [Bradyrhizobium sp. BR 10289]|uniref:hypothetical protein n=1 Tax=Bradyrhizobium sp. BR 10289 TaxID=2749993 RepID=UPI001C64D08E|nr:hypothetical protein [Bradyrhizobium sp. BR 10289]MBW7968338.1 hypothetical protein [Bradyrhizobium sp. BR 10289]
MSERAGGRGASPQVIMICFATGCCDDNFAANMVRSDCEGSDDFERYVGFADWHDGLSAGRARSHGEEHSH